MPISARLTISGERVEISTTREAPLALWNPSAQMVMGKSTEAKEINNHLPVIKSKLLACQYKIELRGETVTAQKIKNEYTAVRPNRKKFTEAFEFKLKQWAANKGRHIREPLKKKCSFLFIKQRLGVKPPEK
jgi:hypothetical protein